MDKQLTKLLHKFSRYGKGEKIFIIYNIFLVLCLLITPIIEIIPLNGTTVSNFFLINGYFFKINFIIWCSVIILLFRNTSFRFKNFLTIIFGFKENEHLLNFGLLWVISTAYMSIGETVNLLKENFTYTISLTGGYYFLMTLLLAGLIFTLVLTVQQAQKLKKINIVNMVKEDPTEEAEKNLLKGLFSKENE